MSPASAGNLEVERYIGACLISQNRSKARNDQFVHAREFASDIYHRQQQQQHVNFRLQRCQTVDGWAGGMPLISFANNQRRGRRNETTEVVNRVVEDPNSLARLAVHTQGAPLILTKSFNHRKNKVHRNNNNNNGVAATNAKKQNKCQEQQQSNAISGVDAVSVVSDESSGSANSENCLPRIIKPRKRRKKDRKPPLLGRPLSQDGFSTDSASPDIDKTQTSNVATFGPFIPFTFDPYATFRLSESPKLIDRLHILGDISETPKLHHSFEDIEEPDDGKDINGNQSTSTCQCRYCDPSGQIWDVDRNCYSPFLTPPNSKNFQFPQINLKVSYSSPVSTICLEHSMSNVSLEDEEEDGKKIPQSRSSSSSSCRDLEVSTEIVTSLNGHRDLEIKFFSSPSVDVAKEGCKHKSCDLNEVIRSSKCVAVNSDRGLVSEE